MSDYRPAALEVVGQDGCCISELRYEGYEILEGSVELPGLPSVWAEKEDAQTWMLVELILTSILLTGFGIYPKIVKWGGAGALVPITGFANSVVAPAIEYKAEGHVFGIGCKIFTIAGPVILFGVFTSWILGIILLIGKILGIA